MMKQDALDGLSLNQLVKRSGFSGKALAWYTGPHGTRLLGHLMR
jgi:hypothetical protein